MATAPPAVPVWAHGLIGRSKQTSNCPLASTAVEYPNAAGAVAVTEPVAVPHVYCTPSCRGVRTSLRGARALPKSLRVFHVTLPHDTGGYPRGPFVTVKVSVAVDPAGPAHWMNRSPTCSQVAPPVVEIEDALAPEAATVFAFANAGVSVGAMLVAGVTEPPLRPAHAVIAVASDTKRQMARSTRLTKPSIAFVIHTKAPDFSKGRGRSYRRLSRTCARVPAPFVTCFATSHPVSV
jgi:hypothetical protein